MGFKDNEKQKAYLREYGKATHAVRYAAVRRRLEKYLGGVCAVCGTTDQLEFDHIDRDTKEFAIMRKWNRSWAVLQPELDKCQLLCKVHHLEKTRRDLTNSNQESKVDHMMKHDALATQPGYPR